MNSPGGHLVVGRSATIYGMANLNFFALAALSAALFFCFGPESTETSFEPPLDTVPVAEAVGADWKAIILQDFICGDNCYLRYTTHGNSEPQEANEASQFEWCPTASG